MGVAIFCAHLAWGVWFVTVSPTNQPKTPLRAHGEQYLKSFPSWDTDFECDSAFHNRAAIGVMQTGVPRTRSGAFCDHSPVYAYFMAACYWIGGVRLLSIAIPQAVVDALVGVFLGLAASRLSAGGLKGSVAVLVALLVLANWHLAGSVAAPSPTGLLMLTFALALFAAGHPTRGNVVLFASAIAAGIFTHAAFFVVGGAAGLWLLIQFARRQGWIYLGCATAVLAVAAVKLGLGMVNTSSNSQDHIRQASQGILWQGNNPYYEDMHWGDLWEQRLGKPSPWSKWHKTEAQEQRSREYLERGGGNWSVAGRLWIRENPAKYAKLCLIRLRTELGPFTGNESRPSRLLGTFLWVLVFPAGIYGVWRARGSAFWLLAILIIGAIVSFDSLVFVNFRYRMPVDMILTAYAGLAYLGLLRSWTGVGRREISHEPAKIPR